MIRAGFYPLGVSNMLILKGYFISILIFGIHKRHRPAGHPSVPNGTLKKSNFQDMISACLWPGGPPLRGKRGADISGAFLSAKTEIKNRCYPD